MITQANRLLAIDTPLDFDVLLMDTIQGVEAMSRPFKYEVRLVAEIAAGNPAKVDPEKLVGNEVTCSFRLAGGTEFRYIHGIVKSFTVGAQDERFVTYWAEIVPWLELLKMSSNCRFFQNLSAPEIIEQVFKDLGMSAYKLDLRSSYTSRDYCAQYRETDFDFVSRLMEEEGIFYYFEHKEDSHTMVLADSAAAYLELPHSPLVRFTRFGGVQEVEDIIMGWEETRELQSSKWKMRDFHFELQPKTLEVERPAVTVREAAGHLAMYDYPGGYAKKFNETSKRLDKVLTEGDGRINRMRMEADEAHVKVFEGESNIGALTAGYKLKVARDDTGQVIGSFLIRDVTTEAKQVPDYVSEFTEENAFRNFFHLIPAETIFRPPQTCAKPLVAGPQSAWVVDESNADPCAEEIWPDKFGRVRVRFQWDVTARYACWLRVAQPWAGRGWGHQWVPRTGDEVLVDFVEGDPDNPIVIGSLYSPRNMPPFTLPDYKTRSGIVTRTSTKGTTHEFNMLRFEDKRGNEQVMIRSQRRMDVRVLASYYETTHANRHILTGLPKGTESGGSFNVTVGGEHNLHVKGDVFEGFDKKHNHAVKSDVANDLQSNEATMVKAKYELNARQIIIEALQQITLKAGSSFITLDLTGITIQAPMVKINCGGAATGCSPMSIDDPVDAAVSDNGEPGYLEWLQSQRGSGGGHRHRTVNPQHGPNVTLEPNGNFRVNRGLVVDGSDPDFARKALNDVALIGTTPEGQRVLNNLDTSGRQTTISKRPPNPTDPLNAEAWPVDSAGNRGSNQAFIDSTPAGQPVFDGGGNPIPGPPAPQATGTGVGTDSNVLYDPDQWPAPGVTTAPSDTLLLHELGHSDNQTHGNFDGTPNTACFDTNEERNVITGPDNTYRSQRDVHTRTDHKDL